MAAQRRMTEPKIDQKLLNIFGPLVVTQLTKRCLIKPKDPGSNAVTGIYLYIDTLGVPKNIICQKSIRNLVAADVRFQTTRELSTTTTN